MADDPGPNRCLAVIPARGGSKGLPRKNVRLLAGVPLISRAVQVACQAKSVTRVVVTTDDVEIGQVAQNSGADVVWRPAELATDAASSESAVLHVLRELEDSEGYRPEKVVMMQCTAGTRDNRENRIFDAFIRCIVHRGKG